jgi:hypothetical protein
MKHIRATVAAVKHIPGWDRHGWGSFKMRLMDVLGVPRSEFQVWVVPQDWIDAFKKANGR